MEPAEVMALNSLASSSSASSSSASGPSHLWKKLRSDWLILAEEESTYPQDLWTANVQMRMSQLEDAVSSLGALAEAAPIVLIAEPEPQQFLCALWAALRAGWTIALANPDWGQQEWRSVSATICPTLVWGKAVPDHLCSHRDLAASAGVDGAVAQILIPTGGTSGKIKFVHHTWQTLLAAVEGFCQHFAPSHAVDSYCVLPLYHVSGLMQVLRSLISGGQLAIAPFKYIESIEPNSPLPFSARSSLTAISLVPTQLHRLLESNKSSWLKQFDIVFLGGAPAWPDLIEAAHTAQIPLSLSYGMTETAAMVTALAPEDFWSGDRTSGKPLPHAALTILNSEPNSEPNSEQPLPPGQTGRISIQSASIPRALSPSQTLLTDDLGYFDMSGHLHITGRASQTIISGGENISPTEVEAAIRSTGQVKDVCVFALPDAQWGEAVSAAYVPAHEAVTAHALQQALRSPSAARDQQGTPPILSRYKHPKHWLALEAMPRNAQGKLNRQALITQAQRSLLSS